MQNCKPISLVVIGDIQQEAMSLVYMIFFRKCIRFEFL